MPQELNRFHRKAKEAGSSPFQLKEFFVRERE